MKPFYDQLKGADPNEPLTLTPEMALRSCMDTKIIRFNPTWTLEVFVTHSEARVAAVMGHALSTRPEPLWWLFSVQQTQAFTSWLEILATLLRKAWLMLVRTFLREPDTIYLQGPFRELQPLPEPLLVSHQGF